MNYFYIKFGDFLNGLYFNTKEFYDKQNEGKEDICLLPYMNFHINNMMDIYENLENDYFCHYFYLVIFLFFYKKLQIDS